jgi:hypothetical protein
MNSITNLTPGQLRQAADLKERIDALQDQLNVLLGGAEPTPAAAGVPKKRKMSAAGRARIAAAARARWAKLRASKPAAKPAQKKKISAAGKARLSALAKARWAKVKAQGKSKL